MQLGYLPNATVDDGSCVEPVHGCTHTAATNLDSLANVDDGSCKFEIYGCTDPRAVNYFVLADIEDGSCLYLGCTDSAAPNYNPAAMLDDGSCEEVVEGCLNSTAVNFSPSANTHNPLLCRFGGCTNSTAKNFRPWASVDDGSCEYYSLGCLDSRAANFNADAEREGGGCLFRGCVHSMATNFDESANLDDGSCTYTSAHGTIASFGYLQSCKTFVDGFSSGFSDVGAAGPEDAFAPSSSLGRYSVHYLERGLVGVAPADVGAGFPCTDSITGTSLSVPLRTAINASIASPLTTVAIGVSIVRRYGQCGGWTSHAVQSGAGIDCLLAASDELESVRNAEDSSLVCRNLVPQIACSASLQPCDAATGSADACSLNGEPLRCACPRNNASQTTRSSVTRLSRTNVLGSYYYYYIQ